MKRYNLVGSALLCLLALGAWASMPAPGYPGIRALASPSPEPRAAETRAVDASLSYRLGHDYRMAALDVARYLARARPELGGEGVSDRTEALYMIGLRVGIDDQYAVTDINRRRVQVVHPASITYFSRDWYPGHAMQPPDGHTHDELQHSDTLDGGFTIDPDYLARSGNDTTLYGGARGYGASAGTGGRCERGANLKILKPTTHTGTEEDAHAAGSLTAVSADSTRLDTLDVIDVNDLTVDARYGMGGSKFPTSGGASVDGANDVSCVWWAFQTARGDGLAFKELPVLDPGFSHDAIITGGTHYADLSSSGDVRIHATQYVLLMHNTISQGDTEWLNVHSRCDDDLGGGEWYQVVTAHVTVQENFFFESFQTGFTSAGCKTAWLDSGSDEVDDDSIPNSQENVEHDYIRNFFSTYGHRGPRGQAEPLRLIENVWFNWNQAAIETEGKKHMDVIDNYFKGSAETGLRRREIQYHFGPMEIGGDIQGCTTREGGEHPDCVEPEWELELGVTHRLTGLLGPVFYVAGNAGRNTRYLVDDSIQRRLMSKYHNEQDDSLPENEYCPSTLDCVRYWPEDTIAANSGDSFTGIYPDSLDTPQGGMIYIGTVDAPTTESAIPGDSDLEASQLITSLSRKIGAYYVLNSDGSRRTEIDAAEDTNFVAVEDSLEIDEVTLTTGTKQCSDLRLGSCIPSRSDGSSWTDSDSDGLPDVYENAFSASNTALDATADPDGDGRSNYVEFLSSTEWAQPDSAETPGFGLESTGGGGGGTQLTCTFDEGGSCRQVLIVDATVDTLITSDTSGGRDTTVFRSLDRTNIPSGVQTCPVYKPDGDSAAVVMDSVASSGVDDSTTVDGVLTAWGVGDSVSVIRGWAEDANGVICGGS